MDPDQTAPLKSQADDKADDNCCDWQFAEYNLANFSNLFLHTGKQTVWTLIRLLLEEQSDLGPHCLQK